MLWREHEKSAEGLLYDAKPSFLFAFWMFYYNIASSFIV